MLRDVQPLSLCSTSVRLPSDRALTAYTVTRKRRYDQRLNYFVADMAFLPHSGPWRRGRQWLLRVQKVEWTTGGVEREWL